MSSTGSSGLGMQVKSVHLNVPCGAAAKVCDVLVTVGEKETITTPNLLGASQNGQSGPCGTTYYADAWATWKETGYDGSGAYDLRMDTEGGWNGCADSSGAWTQWMNTQCNSDGWNWNCPSGGQSSGSWFDASANNYCCGNGYGADTAWFNSEEDGYCNPGNTWNCETDHTYIRIWHDQWGNFAFYEGH